MPGFIDAHYDAEVLLDPEPSHDPVRHSITDPHSALCSTSWCAPTPRTPADLFSRVEPCALRFVLGAGRIRPEVVGAGQYVKMSDELPRPQHQLHAGALGPARIGAPAWIGPPRGVTPTDDELETMARKLDEALRSGHYRHVRHERRDPRQARRQC